MNQLTDAERALVALGAAVGSNGVPCIQAQIPAARKGGLSESQIGEALEIADRVRQVPARDVLRAARDLVPDAAPADRAKRESCGCSSPSKQNSTQSSCCP